MRHTAGRLNRTWLTIIGLVLTLAGTVWLLIATGVSNNLLPAGLRSPSPSEPPVALDSFPLTSNQAGPGILATAGVILVILALAWLAAQIPRRHRTSNYRIHKDASTGLTTLDPKILQDALNHDVGAIPDVLHARSVLRGSASSPDLTLKVTLSSRADPARVFEAIRTEAVEHFTTSLGTPLAGLGVEVDVDARTGTSSTVSL